MLNKQCFELTDIELRFCGISDKQLMFMVLSLISKIKEDLFLEFFTLPLKFTTFQLVLFTFVTKWSFFYFFAEFRNGKSPILVATDVAARGLGQFIVLMLVWPDQ